MKNKELFYILKEIRKAKRKTVKTFNYLYNQQKPYWNENLKINIHRLSDIDEILSNLKIHLEIMLENREENKNDKQIRYGKPYNM